MKLLKLEVGGEKLFSKATFSMDLYATDRIVAGEDGTGLYGISRVGDEGNIYSQNAVGISGVNASGKTTSLNLLEFAACYLGIPYLMRSDRFSWDTVPAKLGDEFTFKAMFAHEGKLYQLVALLGLRDSDEHGWYEVHDEMLYQLRGKHPSKRSLSSFDAFASQARLLIHRNAVEGEPGALTGDQKLFLRDDMSVVAAVTKRRMVHSHVATGRLYAKTYDTAVVHAFDSSIDYLQWDADSEVYHLKFHGEDEHSVSRGTAERELSTGTVFGSELVMRAVDILRQGGLMIVDEIERGLNKSLVKAIIELFLSLSTNSRGAQLVFTTHCPEILDLLPRKDDVYLFVRNAEHTTSAIKYSDRVSRIENKKSEVVLSNYVRGTVPDYPDIRSLQSFVRKSVKVSADE